MRYIVACVIGLACVSGASGQTFFGPTPYLSFAGQSPFAGLGFSSFYLENFEDGLFNTPGATASSGWRQVGPGIFTDSVDEDADGINGTGAFASSFYSGNTESQLTITFDALALGQLPTHAGLVWTDVGEVTPGLPTGFGNFTFEAFGPGNVLLGSVGPSSLGDGAATGATAEDRFFGVISAGGISSIRITSSNSVDWEVDHIQYGIVPAPATLSIVGVVGMLASRRRRA